MADGLVWVRDGVQIATAADSSHKGFHEGELLAALPLVQIISADPLPGSRAM